MSHPLLHPFSRNKYTNQYLNAARYLGLEFRQLKGRRGAWVISDGDRSLSIAAAVLGCNNLLGARISGNKFLTYQHLARGGFRVPDFCRYDTSEYGSPEALCDATVDWARTRFPVVVKPTRGSGGANVVAGISDETELFEVLGNVWREQLGEILVEKHIEGNHYRINLFDGENINMAARYPAFVSGDGRSTIETLIEQKNARKRQQGDAVIQVGDRVLRHLGKAGRSLDWVLDSGQVQILVAESNLNLGGDVERMPVDVVRPGLNRYFQSLYHYLGLRWLGLDLIVDDVASDDAHETCYINETSTAHPCHEHLPSESVEEHLAMSGLILQRFFDLPATVHPWSHKHGLPSLGFPDRTGFGVH